MKKNALSLAVATSVAALTMATAQAAMYQNHEGTGEVLLFPFYDAENGNATNMHIVNTSATEVKAVKVRFLEYKASYEVLDFNLYLSPKDHFAFGVIMDPNGTGAAIITSDNSCTVPALGTPNNGFDGTSTANADGSITRIQPFVNFEFVTGEFVDQSVERTLRGHVEVIEMGVVTNADTANPPTPTQSAMQFASFATHGADGVPANCAGLEAAFVSGAWKKPAAGAAGGPGTNVTAPTGGLYGLAYHINVEDAAAWGFEPTAIAEWSDTDVHTNPGDYAPSLGSGTTSSSIFDQGAAVTTVWADGTDAVSSLLMTTSITNDVMLNSAIGGQTDWVTTFPTKRNYVTTGYVAQDPAAAPFTEGYFGITKNAAGTAYEEDLACEGVTVTSTDREEAYVQGGNSFSPRPPGGKGSEICDEQHTVAWGTGTTSALNVERDLYNLGFSYTEGWATFDFEDTSALCPQTGDCLVGLPATGFAAYKYANGSTGSVMMNYGHAAEHKTNTLFSAQ